MSDIYWLITLGNLSTACMAIFIVSICALIGCFIVASWNIDREWESEKRNYNAAVRAAKYTLVAMIVGGLGAIFIPSEKQLYAIYGIGGVVDYVKSNDTAKQIPNKVVNYLNAWVDKQLTDDANR